ncbi:MAG: DNA polymerase III subunit delta [Clostridiales bacterium]|nr:DNA polymerase III subunit delta [Clostridiales bacterium]
MNHTEFFKTLKSGTIAPVYLFCGEEGYVLKSALKRLIDAVVPADLLQVNLTVLPKDANGQEIVQACETFPFFSEKRMVVLEESGFVSSLAKPDKEECFLEYLKSPMESTVLVVICASPDKRKKCFNALTNHTVVEFNALSDSELMAWIEKTLRTFNLTIERNALLFLIEYAEATPQSLICELEKLASYKKEGVVNKDDIINIITPSTDYNVFNMTDALLRKDVKTALSLLSHMLCQKEEPILILGAISKQYRQILMIKSMLENKKSKQEILSTLKTRDFIYKKYENICLKLSVDAINKAVDLCYKTDEGLKTGACFDEAALHSLILQITMI